MGWILSLALLAGSLTGCAGAPAAESTGTSTAVSGAPESAETPAAAESANTPETSHAEAPAWPRTITDFAEHEIVLEKKPERIALLHVFWMEHFLLLGAPPAASAIGNALGQTEALEASEMYAPYLENLEIINLGSAREINLEAILESEPDVIVTHAAQGGVADVYDQLVQIAPVVLLDYAMPWQDQLLACAEIVGKEDDARALIAEIEPAISGAKEAAERHTDRTFALFRTDGKNFLAQGGAAYYDAFGLMRSEGFPASSGESLSLEAVAGMNPYYIAFQHNYDASVSFVESLESSSVWQSLDAVKNGRIYYFDENMNTFGPLAMQLAAEKLADIYSE
jgi:iron complex transport system substrate-binding protein